MTPSLHDSLAVAAVAAQPSAELDTLVALRTAPLAHVVEHVVEVHHAYTREALARIATLAAKVRARYAAERPEIIAVTALAEALREDLLFHMTKEERILFPYIVALEREGNAHACFATVAQPISAMRAEHESANSLFEELRALTSGLVAPDGVCASFRALYAAIEELERDLHQHVHIENEVLFPRAESLEAAIRTRGRRAVR
jgi:regulator of cell morphogenesis and NO signaling